MWSSARLNGERRSPGGEVRDFHSALPPYPGGLRFPFDRARLFPFFVASIDASTSASSRVHRGTGCNAHTPVTRGRGSPDCHAASSLCVESVRALQAYLLSMTYNLILEKQGVTPATLSSPFRSTMRYRAVSARSRATLRWLLNRANGNRIGRFLSLRLPAGRGNRLARVALVSARNGHFINARRPGRAWFPEWHLERASGSMLQNDRDLRNSASRDAT